MGGLCGIMPGIRMRDNYNFMKKFIFNYMKNDYCLIQHYQSNVLIGMERMNYVIKYIIDHRNSDKKQTE